MEYDVNNEAASVYDYGVQRNSYTNQRSGASQTQYYLYDGQGSVSSLTSVYGNPLVTYQYDAYGVAQVSGETYSPYQYNAEAVDTNTGLQYLRARYYNSSIGSFITQDTYTGTLEDPLTQNLYTYTGNNPINYVDPSGHRYDDFERNTGKSINNPFSKRDSAPKRKITAGIEDILPTPGGKNLRDLSNRTNQKVKTTAGITDYINIPSAIDTYVDPVTQRLQNMYGDVTKIRPAYAYSKGRLVTALTEIERKMCEVGDWSKTYIKNKVDSLPESVKKIASFFKGVGDSTINNLMPFEISGNETSYPIMYYFGKLTGDLLNILDMLYAISGGGKGQGNGENLALEGEAGGSSGAVLALEGEGALVGGLAGRLLGENITNDINNLKKAIDKARSGEYEGGSKTYGEQLEPSDQKMYQQGQHYNKHGKDMGYASKKEYEAGARDFIKNNKANAEIFEGKWNSSRGGQKGETQIIIRADGKQAIINKKTGQIIDFYEGTSLDGFIKIKKVQ
jgi:RHS repeat-associated protein